MRKIRSISIRIRNIVSGLDALLLLLWVIGLGELDELLTFCVHPSVMLVPGLVADSTLDVRFSHVHISTSCILMSFFFNGLLLLLERLSVVGWLRSSLLNLIHHIPSVILRRSHFILLHKLTYHLLKPLNL
jgi:hypothetical protein